MLGVQYRISGVYLRRVGSSGSTSLGYFWVTSGCGHRFEWGSLQRGGKRDTVEGGSGRKLAGIWLSAGYQLAGIWL